MKIAFTNNKKSLDSKLIRFFTGGNWSHCFPIVGDVDGVDICLSADEITVNLVPITKYLNVDKYDLEIYDVPVLFSTFSEKYLLRRFHHKNYGWLDLLWFVCKYLFEKLGWKFKGNNPIDVGIFCSELTVFTLLDMGYRRVFKGKTPNSIGPSELRDIVKELPGARRVK